MDNNDRNVDYVLKKYTKLNIPIPRDVQKNHIPLLIPELNSIIKQCEGIIKSLEKRDKEI